MGNEPSENYEQLDKIAEEFADRFRRGEHPSLDEYCQRYPHLATEIRELFPAMVEIQRAEKVIGHAVEALRHVGDYRIIREIGHGGMGVVYEAEQASLGRRVALKVLSHQLKSDSRSLERFKREARAAAKLHHTNIVPVFEVGQDGEVCYYAMQYIKGQGLEKIIQELRHLRSVSESAKDTSNPPELPDSSAISLAYSVVTGQFRASVERDVEASPEAPDINATVPYKAEPVSVTLPCQTDLSASQTNRRHFFESVARIGRQTASALAHAHQRGVIHRDIKPSNLLLDASGTVWVTDFGLAKTEEDALTRTGDILGTIRYMSPERFKGHSDARSDIYALGMTLRELLVLRPAFESTDRATLIAKIASEDPIRPRAIDPSIPGDLETIVLKAMAKEPERRYQTAEELAEDLRCFLDGEPIKARQVGPLGRARLWCRRNPAFACLYGVLFTVAISASVAAANFSSLFHASENNRIAAENRRIEKEQAERRARVELFTSLVAQADAIRSSHKVGQRFTTLETIKTAMTLARELELPEQLDRLQTIAIAALALPDIRKTDEWQPFGTDFTGAFHTDAAHSVVALVLRNGEIAVCHLPDFQEFARVQYKADSVRLSPDGRFLIAFGNGRCRIWDVGGAEPKVVLYDRVDNGTVFHPDSQHIVMGQVDRSMGLYKLPELKVVSTWRPYSTTPPVPRQFKVGVIPKAFDPSGKRLVVIIDGHAHLLDLTDPDATYKPLLHDALCECVTWHPNGRFVAFVLSTSSLVILDVEKNRWVGNPMRVSTHGEIEAGFTPDGELLVTWGWDGAVRVWQYQTATLLLQYPGANNVQFGRDGRCIFWDNQHLVRADFVTGRECRTFGVAEQFGPNFEIVGGAIHPDGRLLAVATTYGIFFWDLVTGEEVQWVKLEQQYLRAVAFPSRNELVNDGGYGLSVMNVRIEETDGLLFRIGPPKYLNHRQSMDAGLSCSADGTTIAQAMYLIGGVSTFERRGNDMAGGVSVFQRRGNEWILSPFNVRVITTSVALSSDGTMLVTASYKDDMKTRVWSTLSGRQLAEYETWGGTARNFSPDGKWLAFNSRTQCQLIPVGKWQSGIPLEQFFGPLCFSPSSDLLAVETGAGAVQCYDPETGRKLMRFEAPHQDGARWLGFTPNGTRLVATCNESAPIHVWDLHLIRQELRELGLDWDRPPYAAFSEAGMRPKPRLRVVAEPEQKK
jgi:serine/threonine protein kinase/WD40 repeat protein